LSCNNIMRHHRDSRPLVKARRRMCSWCGLDTLRGSCWWATFPCQSQCRHPASVSSGSPADNHSFPTLCAQHQAQSPPAQLLPCSDPSPSCCQHRSDQTQSCLDERFARMDQIWPSPWFLVQDPQGQLVEHTSHLQDHNETHYIQQYLLVQYNICMHFTEVQCPHGQLQGRTVAKWILVEN